MEMRKIDDQIRDYYAQQRPSPDAVNRMKQIIRVGGPARRTSLRSWMTVAGGLMIAAVTLLWTAAQRVSQSPQQVTASIARQAAAVHNENQELEFRVRDSAELQAKMRSLDFTPVEPSMMQGMNMRIVGARYTTLGGEIAAQIVYVDANGVPCTLYEARPVEQLAQIAPGEHQIDGIRVSVWKEKGLVMVLARPMA